MHKIIGRYIKSVRKGFSDTLIYVGTQVRKNVSGEELPMHNVVRREFLDIFWRCMNVEDVVNIALRDV